MKSSFLWAEITISGFVYLTTIFFAVLIWAQQYDLLFLHHAQGYIALLSAGILAASYTLGLLAHRLIPIIVLSPLERVYEIWRNRVGARPRGNRDADPERVGHTGFINIYQYGTDRLNTELAFQFSLLAFFRSLAIGVPTLGITLALWISKTALRLPILPFVAFSFLFAVFLIVVARKQEALYVTLRDAAFEEIQVLRNKAETVKTN